MASNYHQVLWLGNKTTFCAPIASSLLGLEMTFTGQTCCYQTWGGKYVQMSLGVQTQIVRLLESLETWKTLWYFCSIMLLVLGDWISWVIRERALARGGCKVYWSLASVHWLTFCSSKTSVRQPRQLQHSYNRPEYFHNTIQENSFLSAQTFQNRARIWNLKEGPK